MTTEETDNAGPGLTYFSLDEGPSGSIQDNGSHRQATGAEVQQCMSQAICWLMQQPGSIFTTYMVSHTNKSQRNAIKAWIVLAICGSVFASSCVYFYKQTTEVDEVRADLPDTTACSALSRYSHLAQVYHPSTFEMQMAVSSYFARETDCHAFVRAAIINRTKNVPPCVCSHLSGESSGTECATPFPPEPHAVKTNNCELLASGMEQCVVLPMDTCVGEAYLDPIDRLGINVNLPSLIAQLNAAYQGPLSFATLVPFFTDRRRVNWTTFQELVAQNWEKGGSCCGWLTYAVGADFDSPWLDSQSLPTVLLSVDLALAGPLFNPAVAVQLNLPPHTPFHVAGFHPYRGAFDVQEAHNAAFTSSLFANTYGQAVCSSFRSLARPFHCVYSRPSHTALEAFSLSASVTASAFGILKLIGAML